jgi:PAS domain S-box-containing protein
MKARNDRNKSGQNQPGIQREFLEQLCPRDTFGMLFDLLPEVYFFAKDAAGRFVRMNPALLRRLGFSEESEVLGRVDTDFFSLALSERYRREDVEVMERNQPVVDQIWFVPNREGVLAWYLSTKIPLHDRAGRVIGIAGAMRDAQSAGAIMSPYEDLRAAVEHLSRHYAEDLSVVRLAALVHLSVSQFERRFRAIFQMAPMQYLMQLRVENACRQLEHSRASLAEVASQNGFYDQSAFTRQFVKRIGLTPGAYRKRYSVDRGSGGVSPAVAGIKGRVAATELHPTKLQGE